MIDQTLYPRELLRGLDMLRGKSDPSKGGRKAVNGSQARMNGCAENLAWEAECVLTEI
jgi:hypothetical protein